MQNRRLSVIMSRREILAGLCFLPFYLLLLSLGLQALLRVLLDREPELMELNLLYYAVCFAAVLLIFHAFLWKNRIPFLEQRATLFPTLLRAVLFYYGLTLLVGIVVTTLSPEFQNQNDSTIHGMMEGGAIPIVILSVLLAPVIEETIFRGLVFSNLLRFGRFPAYGITALFFSAIHVVSYVSTMEPLAVCLSILQYLPATLVFCALYERTDTIFAPMMLHAAINLINCIVMLAIL